MEYGPDYELNINSGNMKDSNNKDYLKGIYRQLMGNIIINPHYWFYVK